MADLLVVSPRFLLAVGAGAGLAWLLFLRVRRLARPGWRGRLAGIGVLTIASVLTLVTTADAVNAQFSYLPHLADVAGPVVGGGDFPHARVGNALGDAPVPHPHGAVVTVSVPDRGSGFGPTPALVYLPPQYFTEPNRHFAVVYLIHGSPGVPADWFRGGAAAAAAEGEAVAGEPVIIVAPTMSHAWLDDPECVDGISERVETHLLLDVVPSVDATLRTTPTRGARALAGMSAGGYCALNLGLRNRDVFATVVDMSGLNEPTHAGGLASIFGRGPAAERLEAANDPGRYAATLPPGPRTRVWLVTGRNDRETRADIERMARELPRPSVEVTLHLPPGAHTFYVWRPALVHALQALAPMMVTAADRG